MPVALYFFVVFTMAWRALALAAGSTVKTHHLSAVGCMIFVISDCVIIYNTFVSPLARQQEIIMVTYYLGQFLITLSAAQE
jgi:alkenylglycerophosphocholine/alkenylglycerophosphoethanolamine hydrolase